MDLHWLPNRSVTERFGSSLIPPSSPDLRPVCIAVWPSRCATDQLNQICMKKRYLVGSARQHSGPASLKNAPLNETWGDAGHTQPLPRPRVSACSSLAGVVQHAGHGGMLGMGECWAYPAAASVTRGCKAPLCPPVDEVGEQAVCPLLGLHCHDC